MGFAGFVVGLSRLGLLRVDRRPLEFIAIWSLVDMSTVGIHCNMVFGGYVNRWNQLCHGQVDRKCSRHFSAFPPSVVVPLNRWNKFHHGQVAARRRLGDNLRGMAINARQTLCRNRFAVIGGYINRWN